MLIVDSQWEDRCSRYSSFCFSDANFSWNVGKIDFKKFQMIHCTYMPMRFKHLSLKRRAPIFYPCCSSCLCKHLQGLSSHYRGYFSLSSFFLACFLWWIKLESTKIYFFQILFNSVLIFAFVQFFCLQWILSLSSWSKLFRKQFFDDCEENNSIRFFKRFDFILGWEDNSSEILWPRQHMYTMLKRLLHEMVSWMEREYWEVGS